MVSIKTRKVLSLFEVAALVTNSRREEKERKKERKKRGKREEKRKREKRGKEEERKREEKERKKRGKMFGVADMVLRFATPNVCSQCSTILSSS